MRKREQAAPQRAYADSPPRIRIAGEAVALRELRWEDMGEMERWPRFAEPELQWANFDLKTPAQKEAWFRQELHDPSRKRFAITLDGRLIGVLGLRAIDYRQGRATLGIRLSAGEVGKGYGTDAIKALLAHAFGSMRLRHVDLDVAEDNGRARRCYEKCGFRVVGRRRDYRGQVYIDMTISAREFEAQRKGPLPS